MDLVPEDGTGVAGANTWVTADFADDYHSSFGNIEWVTADADKRKALLLRAVSSIIVPRYSGKWRGEIYREGQELPWPRVCFRDDENRWYDTRNPYLPTEIKFLQCEVALAFILDPTLDQPKRRGLTISSEKIGPITTVEQFDSKQSPVLSNPRIARLVRPWLERGNNNFEIVRS